MAIKSTRYGGRPVIKTLVQRDQPAAAALEREGHEIYIPVEHR